MKIIIKNAFVYENGQFVSRDFSFSSSQNTQCDTLVFDSLHIFPGFADVHVHFREPGFCYKETIATGSRAAARGGYTSVCTMPNLNPVPDCAEALQVQLDAIKKNAAIQIVPYGAITVGQRGEQLADMQAMSPYVAGFSDDGRGIQTEDTMRCAMLKAKKLNKIIVAHCEDNRLLHGGYIHAGDYAAAHGHRGICSESEWGPIERDLQLVRETGSSYHVCHISTKESVQLIRKAKAEGLDVTCETAPHYLLMDDSMLQEDGRFKMNPPLRSAADRNALIEGLMDGTIDMIATDHAPHSMEEKSRGLQNSTMGVVGIETAFPLMYTYFVRTGLLTPQRLIELMCTNARKRFGLNQADINTDFTAFDFSTDYPIDPADFISMGKSTPFTGWNVCGQCAVTVANGKLAWLNQEHCI